MESCLVDECLKAPKSRGLCGTHYARDQRAKYGTCSVADCRSQATNRRGWCAKHYSRVLIHGTTDEPPPRRKQPLVCTVDGCENPHKARGWCGTHWKRWRTHGTTDLPGPPEEFFCRGCKQWHSRESYDPHQARCRTCARAMKRDARQLRTYRVFGHERQAQFEKQGGRCAICRRPETELKFRLAIDHDHVTGRVRGLLCNDCNLGLGKFRDNPALLRKAIRYLAQR